MKITLGIVVFLLFIVFVFGILWCCQLQNDQQVVPTQNIVLERTRQRRNENPVSSSDVVIDTNDTNTSKNEENTDISVIYTKNQRNNSSEIQV
jgi:uncharacterized protein YcfL